RASLHAAAIPRSACTQSEVGHGRDPESASGERIGPSPDCVDTKRLDQTAPSDRPAHNSPRTSRETTGPIPGGGRASDFFWQSLRQHVLMEREVRYRPRQPAVSFLQLPQAPEFTHPEVGVLFLPGIERLLGDPELPAQVTNGGTAFSLPDGIDDLFFRKLRPLHRSTPFVEDRRSRHLTPVLTRRRFRGRRHESTGGNSQTHMIAAPD